MNRKSLVYLYIIIVPSILLSCIIGKKSIKSGYHLDLSVRNDIQIDSEKILSGLSKYIKQDTDSDFNISIVIFNYSSGKETTFYSKDAMTMNKEPGSLEAMIKIKEYGKLLEIQFIKVKGNSKQELIENLINQIVRLVNEN